MDFKTSLTHRKDGELRDFFHGERGFLQRGAAALALLFVGGLSMAGIGHQNGLLGAPQWPEELLTGKHPTDSLPGVGNTTSHAASDIVANFDDGRIVSDTAQYSPSDSGE